MVCEIQMRQGNGDWEAFLADHTPPALDDQLKKAKFEQLSIAFGKMSPTEVLRAIPVTMPMTHLATIDGKQMEGVAKYPVDAWLDSGAPSFTTERWAMICMLLAERGLEEAKNTELPPEDREVFEKLFAAADTLAADFRP